MTHNGIVNIKCVYFNFILRVKATPYKKILKSSVSCVARRWSSLVVKKVARHAEDPDVVPSDVFRFEYCWNTAKKGRKTILTDTLFVSQIPLGVPTTHLWLPLVMFALNDPGVINKQSLGETAKVNVSHVATCHNCHHNGQTRITTRCRRMTLLHRLKRSPSIRHTITSGNTSLLSDTRRQLLTKFYFH